MSTPPLTPNGVKTIITMTSGTANPAFKPIFQVISLRNVGATTGGKPRYRAVLSDGTNFIQGMLATQLIQIIEETQDLKQDSVIEVEDFMNNKVQDKHVIILLKLKVVGNPGSRIGSPTDIELEPVKSLGTSNGMNNAVGGGAAPPMYNRPNNNNGQMNNSYPSPSKQQGGRTNNSYSPSRNMNNMNLNTPGNRNQSSNPYGGGNRSNAPIVHQGHNSNVGPGMTANGTPITSIAQLNMYQNRWTVKARVVSKSDIRTWSNAKGEGSLFSFEILDSSGMDIRATCFKEAVDKWYNFLSVGKVYTFSGGRLKVANQQYNTCKSQFEVTFDHQSSEIHLVDDIGDISGAGLDITQIQDIERVEQGKHVDLLAVIQEIGEVQNLLSKKSGKEIQKSDITVVDQSGAQIRVTLWGNSAVTAQNDLQVGKVAGIRRARVSDYGGKSLSGPQSVDMEPNIPQTRELQQWWSANGQNMSNVKSLSAGGGGGASGRMEPFENRLTISDIKTRNLGYGMTNPGSTSNSGDYLTFKAHFNFFKKDREGGAWYPACLNKEDPCRNRCKVTQTTDGQWQCDRCHGVFPSCDFKWIFSGTVVDDTSTTWVSLFDDQAQSLFGGVTANEAQAQFDNQDAYDGHFAKATHTEWVIKCRVKQEAVNDETRIKTTVVAMNPVDYASECRDMLSAMEKWGISAQ